MSEVNKDPNAQPEIVVNQHDGVVAVAEVDRTELLTPNDTIIVEKPPQFDFPPANRPRKVYGGMWGPVEIGVVGAASLAVIAAIAAYFFFTLPAKRELERNRATAARLEADMISAKAKYGEITNIEEHVAKLVSSVDDFETTYLPVAANGNTALYQKLNNLIFANNLINTNGPDYAPLEVNDQGTAESQSESERGRSRFRSLFPGTYVTMTLEGSYADLRRFISQVETGNDFVIISSIELQPSDKQNTASKTTDQPSQQVDEFDTGFSTSRRPVLNPNQPRRPTGRTLGQIVSLRIEMAAYYKRPTMETRPANVPAQ